MRYGILITIVSLLFLGCKKDSSGSKPQLTYKSASASVLYPGQIIQFDLSFSDDAGNASDGLLYIQKITPDCSLSNFIDSVNLPTFPYAKNQLADIVLSYANGLSDATAGYKSIAPQCTGINDTCYFRFVLKDDANHSSDTVNSGTIVILNQ